MVYGGTRTWSSSVLESNVSLIELIKDEEEKEPLSPKKQPASTNKKSLNNDKSAGELSANKDSSLPAINSKKS